MRVLVFPELSLTASTCGDLFYYETLIKGAEAALCEYLNKTKHTATLAFVGLPVAIDQKLYNCAAACYGGQLLGLIPKTAVSRAESRHFATAPEAVQQLKEQGYTVFSTEQCEGSTMLQALEVGIAGSPSASPRYAIVLGNEVKGVHQEVVDASDGCIEIPQFGTKHSLNVSVSVGVILWHFRLNMK